jgi:hypothetical protein
MTTEVANLFYDMKQEFLTEKLSDFKRVHGAKHAPSIRNVKAVAGYLGHRQRNRSKYGLDVIDDSIKQIASALAISVSAISDVLRFLQWCGFLSTVRHGGGRRKLPTVRRLEIAFLKQELIGIRGELNEIFCELHGKSHDLLGAFPETPIGIPRYIPRVNTSTDEEFSFEEPFNEEDFVEEEFGFTPDDVLVCINRFEIDCDVASSDVAWEPF